MSDRTAGPTSEVEFQGHLDLARCALEEYRLSGAADLSRSGRADARAGRVELRRVEQIEELRPVFEAPGLGLRETELFEHGKVHLLGPRSVQDVSSGVAKQERSRCLERSDVKPALQRALLAGKVAVADAVGPLPACARAESVLRG